MFIVLHTPGPHVDTSSPSNQFHVDPLKIAYMHRSCDETLIHLGSAAYVNVRETPAEIIAAIKAACMVCPVCGKVEPLPCQHEAVSNG